MVNYGMTTKNLNHGKNHAPLSNYLNTEIDLNDKNRISFTLNNIIIGKSKQRK